MDLNFAELKKEASSTAEDIFGNASNAVDAATKKVSHTYDELLGGIGDGNGSGGNVSSGAQDDNAHTEHYFANEQKNLDFGDPQAFVQRMSAGAKEAQEQLDAKFAQKTSELDDFLGQAGKGVKQGVSDLTSDFMNAERSFFGGVAPAPAPNSAVAPVPPPDDDVEDLLGSFSDKPTSQQPEPAQFAPSAPAKSNFYGVDDILNKSTPPPATTAAAVAPIVGNKDSDTDSPSVSYTPSPAKKPVTDALKEQDNEQFISSEDLLSDFKEERTATPPFTAPLQPMSKVATSSAAAVVTDLDDDDNFEPTFTPKSEPAKPVAAPVVPPPQVPKVEPPKAKPTTAAPPPPPQKQQSQQPKSPQPQPNIVSVEEIFYKYGLVESLIYWRDVKKSGIVFGAGLIILVAISCFSVISVFAYLSLLALFGTIAFRIYRSVTQAVQKTNDGHPFKEYLELDLTLSQEKVQNFVGVAVAHVNGFTAELRRLFLVEDLIDSIKFGVILWVFTYIGAWFNGMTLVILAFVSLFTLPKVYENNKQSIDTYLDLVRSKLTEITDKIKVAIPIGNKKPVGAAAESDKDK
ncbi:reticulon-1 isoform X2 [Scaptodrosophila lebanonensis]|uniref:Reticulon-like protein n=1 Tax=Drosophila lebanonensis TaxID=7225 RepID=A0A6J2U586_DROLE|nr:reticulon-1 isoform X2 [Scaptodrosophila lebanonensis]